MNRIITLLIVTVLTLATSWQNLQSKPAHVFKIASLAPEGSVWVNVFEEFTKEVSEKTNGEVGFRYYPGGIMGDDRAMYRKMKVGQLHGGGFTMTGIAEIVPDFRVMAIPFLFRSYQEADYVRDKMVPLFKKRFADEGMQLIAMTEVGFIYTFSNQARTTIADLQQAKTWAPSNDPLTSAFLASLDISPITLSIPDVLSSLQTGLIDTAFNSLYGSIVLQWYVKAPYVTDQPYGYAYGVFILDKKKFSKLSADHQAVIEEAAQKHFSSLILQTRKSNEDSRSVLSSQGVSFVKTTEDVVQSLEKHRDITIKNVMGQAFSVDIYQALDSALTEIRSKKGNAAQ